MELQVEIRCKTEIYNPNVDAWLSSQQHYTNLFVLLYRRAMLRKCIETLLINELEFNIHEIICYSQLYS